LKEGEEAIHIFGNPAISSMEAGWIANAEVFHAHIG
jgi:hypothetical protein